MNTTTIRNLIVALPLAAAAVAMTPGAASADPVGPVIIVAEPSDPIGPGDLANPEPAPQPEPQPEPQPQGPDDKVGPKGDEVDPHGPDDKDGPDDGGGHDGPGGIKNPTCPTHGGGPECVPDQDIPGEDTPTEEPGTPDKKADKPRGADKPRDTVESIALPTRVDAGLAGEVVTAEEDGLALTWLLAGGALVTASGAAFAARRVRRQS